MAKALAMKRKRAMEGEGPAVEIPVWSPHPDNHPQVEAYHSPAFEILYGGQAGGGKSDLLLGLARTAHRHSLLLRREFPDLERSLIERSLRFFGLRKSYNASKHVWNIGDKRIEFGHMERVGNPQQEGDESQYASAAYDFIGFDQLEQFPEYAYEFMLSRARSAVPGQRVRVLSSANPVGAGIFWIMKRWRAWLIDETAKPGEIRWYKRDESGQDVETSKSDPDAVSRTFISAGLQDNPYLGEGYRKQLAMLPEPLRSALLKGDWKAGITDDAYQVIPRAWVRAAQKRWQDRKLSGRQMVIGVDVARGGDDKTVFAPRVGDWFDNLERHPGITTPDGQSVADLLAIALRKGGRANIDIIGVGSSAYDLARARRLNVAAVNFGEGSDATDSSGKLHFKNKRAELYWSFRDALEPTSTHQIELPPDPELEADLVSAHWRPQSDGIIIESKEDIKKRLGRSPDSGDSAILAWAGSHLPSDEDLEEYGRDEIGEASISRDDVEYYMDTFGIDDYDKAKAMLMADMKKERRGR